MVRGNITFIIPQENGIVQNKGNGKDKKMVPGMGLEPIRLFTVRF